MSSRSHDRQRATLMSATGQQNGRLRAVSRGRCHPFRSRSDQQPHKFRLTRRARSRALRPRRQTNSQQFQRAPPMVRDPRFVTIRRGDCSDGSPCRCGEQATPDAPASCGSTREARTAGHTLASWSCRHIPASVRNLRVVPVTGPARDRRDSRQPTRRGTRTARSEGASCRATGARAGQPGQGLFLHR